MQSPALPSSSTSSDYLSEKWPLHGLLFPFFPAELCQADEIWWKTRWTRGGATQRPGWLTTALPDPQAVRFLFHRNRLQTALCVLICLQALIPSPFASDKSAEGGERLQIWRVSVRKGPTHHQHRLWCKLRPHNVSLFLLVLSVLFFFNLKRK